MITSPVGSRSLSRNFRGLLLVAFGALALVATAFAAEAAPAPQTVMVNYSDIEGTVRSNNQTIRANDKTLDALDNNDAAEQKISALNASAANLQNLSKQLQQADAAAKAQGKDAAIDASLQGSIAALNAAASILSSESDQLGTDPDTVDKTEFQMNGAADQIVVAAQKLFVTWHALDLQRTVLTQKQQVAADTVKAAGAKAAAGLITQTDLLNIRQQQTSASDQLATLVSQMKTVKDSFRVLMGYSDDYDLTIAAMPQANTAEIAKMNDAADSQTAFDANWTLKEKAKEKEIADDNRDSGLDSTVDLYHAAALNYELAKNQFGAAFRQAYDDVSLKQSLLASAQSACTVKAQTLNAVQQQNAVGVASALDLENAQLDAANAKAALSQAQYDLFSSQEQYRWALRGALNLSASGQS